MKLFVASVLVLLAVCAVSAEEESLISSGISYVQDLATDVASKATETLNQVKDLQLAQHAMSLYDTGASYLSSFYTSVLDTANEKWEQLTKSF